MPEKKYWDACVNLRYVEGEPDSLPVIEALLERADSNTADIEIITSVITITEVAFAVQERVKHRLSHEIEERIDALWSGDSPIHLVGFHQIIAREARNLIRAAIVNGWRLKPIDAIHLATARHEGAGEFHTYDKALNKYEEMVGLRILAPYLPPEPPQMRLQLDIPDEHQ